MSNVLKNQRPSSPFLVLTHAVDMRKEITKALLIDFAFHPEKVNDEQVRNGLSGWFLERSRDAIIDALMQLLKNISLANAIYITNMDEYRERRIYQNRAIGYCGVLSQELQYVIETLPVDNNKYTRFSKMITDQVNLLKGWRKADNKVKKKLENG